MVDSRGWSDRLMPGDKVLQIPQVRPGEWSLWTVTAIGVETLTLTFEPDEAVTEMANGNYLFVADREGREVHHDGLCRHQFAPWNLWWRGQQALDMRLAT